jgi:hypothetical protein
MNISRLTRPGRRLFPSLEVLISNLDPSSIYDIYVDFIERGRYAWIESKWVKTHSASLDTDSCYCVRVQQHQAYLHEDSPNCGRFWMAAPISFARVKATNRTKDLQSNKVGSTKMLFTSNLSILFLLRGNSPRCQRPFNVIFCS